jgi:hypothetical protein
LHYAVACNNIGAIKLLASADMNVKNNVGYTALHIAVLQNNSDSIRLLLAQQADPGIPDQSGQTPFDLAFQQPNLVKIFIDPTSVHDPFPEIHNPFPEVPDQDLVYLFSKIPDTELEMAMSGAIPYDDLVAWYLTPPPSESTNALVPYKPVFDPLSLSDPLLRYNPAIYDPAIYDPTFELPVGDPLTWNYEAMLGDMLNDAPDDFEIGMNRYIS